MTKLKNWPATQVRDESIDALKASERNERKHSHEQIAQIAASVEEFGWTIPLLIDEQKKIIAGHARLEAARLLNLETVPVMIAKGWSEAQKQAYRIADNKLSLNAEWDEALLSAALEDLEQQGLDLSLTGFSSGELDDLLGEQAQAIEADLDKSQSGAKSYFLRFGSTKVQITEEELSGLEERYQQHVEETGLSYGFVSRALLHV